MNGPYEGAPWIDEPDDLAPLSGWQDLWRKLNVAFVQPMRAVLVDKLVTVATAILAGVLIFVFMYALLAAGAR